MYTYDFIEEARIGRTLYRTESKDGSHSHSWNYEDHAFYYHLDQWGFEKLFQNSYEAITREFKFYIKYWENLILRTSDNYHVPCFLQNMLVWIYMMKI